MVDFGSITQPLSQAALNVYLLQLQRRLQQEDIARQRQEGFADFAQRLRYQAQLEREMAASDPDRARQLARQRITDTQLLAALTGQPQTIPQETLRTFAGGPVNVPQGGFGDVPGFPLQGTVSRDGGQARPINVPPPGPRGLVVGPQRERVVNIPGIGPVPVSELHRYPAEILQRIPGLEPPAKPTIVLSINGQEFDVSTEGGRFAATQVLNQLKEKRAQSQLVDVTVGGRTFRVPQAEAARIIQAQQRIDIERRGGGSTTLGPSLVPPSVPGGLDVRPLRNKQGAVTHWVIDGVQHTPSQAEELAQQLIVDGDGRGMTLARALRIPQARITAWKNEATGLTAARQRLQKLNDEIAIIDDELSRLTEGTSDYKRVQTQRNRKAIERQRLYEKFPSLIRHGGFRPTGAVGRDPRGRPILPRGVPRTVIPPAIPRQQAVPDDLDEFYK